MFGVFGGQCRHLGRKCFTLGRHVRYIFVDVDLGNHKMRFVAKRFLETVEICFATVFEATTFGGLLLDSCEYPQLVVRQLTHMHTHRLGTFHAPLGALVIGLQQTFLIGNAGQILEVAPTWNRRVAHGETAMSEADRLEPFYQLIVGSAVLVIRQRSSIGVAKPIRGFRGDFQL